MVFHFIGGCANIRSNPPKASRVIPCDHKGIKFSGIISHVETLKFTDFLIFISIISSFYCEEKKPMFHITGLVFLRANYLAN